MSHSGMWYVAPDGTVYSDGNPPPWDGPWMNYGPPRDGPWGEEPPDYGGNSAFVHPWSPPSVLDQARDRLESQARIKRDEAEAEYWHQKAEREKRRNNPFGF